ncbi:MAG: hypothetical protein ACOYO1_20105 [Bacteroidales bacterium]
MKNVSTIIIIIMTISLFSCTNFSKTEYSTADMKVYLKVTPNTTESELKKISTEFKEKRNIDVDYSKSIFSSNGEIKDLVLKVNTNDGYSGEASCTSASLKIKNFGFFRDYSKEAKQNFFIGAL